MYSAKSVSLNILFHNGPSELTSFFRIDLSDRTTPVAGFTYPYYDINSVHSSGVYYTDLYLVDYKTTLKTANLSMYVMDTPYVEGDNIDMFTAIPDRVKQRHFLTSIINMFNLYKFPDPNYPKNIIIQTREDFYTFNDILLYSTKDKWGCALANFSAKSLFHLNNDFL